MAEATKKAPAKASESDKALHTPAQQKPAEEKAKDEPKAKAASKKKAVGHPGVAEDDPAGVAPDDTGGTDETEDNY